MADFESQVIPGESLALTACRRILARTASSGDFAWYMIRTESLSLCVQAVAEASGECPEALAERIRWAAVEIIRKERPTVETQRIELESMREDVDEIILDRERQLEQSYLHELLHHCRVTNQRPTVEAIEHALKGKPLCHCLHQM